MRKTVEVDGPIPRAYSKVYLIIFSICRRRRFGGGGGWEDTRGVRLVSELHEPRSSYI